MLQIRQLTLGQLKCFRAEPVSIKWDHPVTVAIGPNNSGKSTLIRGVYDLMTNELRHPLTFNASVWAHLSRNNRLFHEDNEYGRLVSSLKRLEGATVNFSKRDGGQWVAGKRVELGGSFHDISENEAIILVSLLPHLDLFRHQPVFLSAERDIKSEETLDAIKLGNDGEGATNLVRAHLQSAQTNPDFYNREFIEKEVLHHLNEILTPVPPFTRLDMQYSKVENSSSWVWEVRLTAEGQTPLTLSQLGSGVKSALLIILATMSPVLNPRLVDGRIAAALSWDGRYIFVEEPENNLHPAAQRRLAQFILRHAERAKCKFFIASHSTSFLNEMFESRKSLTLHISRDQESSRVQAREQPTEQFKILRDLGASTADLFLANGIIWVEGPSDRIYIRHWIDICSGGQLIEGVHYQFILYGGALISHYTLNKFDRAKAIDKIKMMQIGLKHFVICDSDSVMMDGVPTKSAVNLLKEAFTDFNQDEAKIWVTTPKEIENYVSAQAFSQCLEIDATDPYKQRIWTSKKHGPGWLSVMLRKKSEPDKVVLASKLVDFIDLQTQMQVGDWKKRMQEVVQAIDSWRPIRSESTFPIFQVPATPEVLEP